MNTTQLTPFQFDSTRVRTITDDQGSIWFVAADVCEALKIRNNREAISRLDDDEKGISRLATIGGKQSLTIINESGLYSLILTSRKPEAKAFKKWITSEVLPSIRDTYNIIEALNNFEVPDDVPDMYVYAIKNTSTGNIKLGISKNPEQRLKQLQTGCDGKLELVAYRKADNGYRDELQLHNENSQYAIHGEWFTKDAKFN